jgi:integrase/recombinase XerD
MDKIIELYRKELLEISCLKDNTVSVYLNIVYKFTDYAKQQLHIDPLTSKTWHLNKWMYQLKINGKGPVFMKDCKVALKSFFSFCLKTGYVTNNPAEKLPPVRIPKSNLNRPLKAKIIIKILSSFHRNKLIGIRNYTIVSILWALGLRVNELLSIKVCDLNLDYDPGHKTGTLLVHGKGGKERTLFIVDILYDTISQYLKAKSTPKRKNSLLFPGIRAKSIGGPRVRQLIQEAAKRLGITERVTPHVFRHTFATDMYNQNVPVDAIRQMMGHETLRETSVYIHITDDLQAEVLKKISIKEQVL